MPVTYKKSMQWHDLFLSLVAFVSELLGTLSGFGSSTFFMPIGVLIEKFNFILALTAMLHVFGNVAKLVLFRKSFDFGLFLKLALPSMILAGGGAQLNRYVAFESLKIYLGIFIMLLAVLFFIRRNIIARLSVGKAAAAIGVSGFVTGLLGTGGALRGIALAGLQLEKNSFVALSAGIDVGGDVIRAVIYLKNGYFDWSHWFYIPILLIAAYLGSTGGKFLLSKINQAQFEKVVMVFVFISGLVLIL